MAVLTSKQIMILLNLLREKYGPGYSSEEGVGSLQAYLSIMLEVAHRRESLLQSMSL
jgi:hypothetical protein